VLSFFPSVSSVFDRVLNFFKLKLLKAFLQKQGLFKKQKKAGSLAALALLVL
jgi:hypothetical protein